MVYNNKMHEEIIKKSHLRSLDYGIEKDRVVSSRILDNDETSVIMDRNKSLINIAVPIIKNIYELLQGSGFFIIITDRDGCILYMLGDEDILKCANDMNMIPGAYMDEKSIGTNAMGIAIKENAHIQVSAKEHFINAYHRWTCSASPIHDLEGNIIGVLNITGGSENVHPHTLGLVVSAVKSIENQIEADNAREKISETANLMNTIVNAISQGIFTVDNRGIINTVNKTACSMLKQSVEELSGKSIEGIFPDWKEIIYFFERGKIYQNEEVVFDIGGVKERYNIDAYPIREDKSITGMVVIVREIQKVFNLVNKYTGMRSYYTFDNIIGNSKEIKRVIEFTRSISNSPSTVLIQGESGTGKEILAQAIHNSSVRRDMGFVAVNCGAIPKNLMESELFGYDDGAFTGARKGGHPGKFELANGGTLFLDEIGEMPMDMQVVLLRALQEGCITRVGGNRYIPVDVRIIAATNKDLKAEVAKGNFREDLYYRLSVIPVTLPPLRERKGDIPLLIDYFLKKKSEKLGKEIPKIKSYIYQKMLDYSWPGNVRELENMIENIVNFNGTTSFSFEPVPAMQQINVNTGVQNDSAEYDDDLCSLDELERRAIAKCIRKYDGNITKISKILGISRNTLYCKIKKYSLENCLKI